MAKEGTPLRRASLRTTFARASSSGNVRSEIPTSRARVEKGRVYVATGDRFVHVLDAETGETLVSHQLKFKISGTVEPSPVVPLGDDRIVVGTRKEIICLETG